MNTTWRASWAACASLSPSAADRPLCVAKQRLGRLWPESLWAPFNPRRGPADNFEVGTLTSEQLQAERQRLRGLLAELATAEKVYAKNPAMIAVIRGRTKAIEDRLYDLERHYAPPAR